MKRAFRGIPERCSRADERGMSARLPLLASLVACLVACALPSVAGAAEIVDRGVASPALHVNGDNVALVTYSVRGTDRHVLYWGAVNWAAKFKRDYSGGWKSKIATTRPSPIAASRTRDRSCRSWWRPATRRTARTGRSSSGSACGRTTAATRPRTSSTSRTGAATSASSRSRPTTATAASTSISGASSRSTASRSSAPSGRSRACRSTAPGRNVYVDYLKGVELAPGQQLPHPSAHRGLLLHVRQPPGLDAGLERPGHG